MRAGIRYLETHAAHVRVSVPNDDGKGRHLERQDATGLVAAAYLHDTSRALDPQLHFHVVVSNMAEGPDGRIRTLDGRSRTPTPARPATWPAPSCRHRLAIEVGLAWQPVHRGLADVEGVSREAIVEMSQRSRDIDRRIDARGRPPTHRPPGTPDRRV